MESFLQDLRYGFRMLLKRPTFSLVALVALALGIGITTAIFSVVNTVLLYRLPFEDPDRLVAAWTRNVQEKRDQVSFSTAEFIDYKNYNKAFEQVGGYNLTSFNLVSANDPIQVDGGQATANLFSLLGVKPLQGRGFLSEEDQPGRNHVVMLSYGFWQRRFSADRLVLGQTITLYSSPLASLTSQGPPSQQASGDSYTVIGILPPEFQVPGVNADLWVPLVIDQNNLSRARLGLRVIARLKPGVGFSQAQSEIGVIAKQIEHAHPETNQGWDAFLVTLRDEDVGDVRWTLVILLVGAILVLFIACANVASLLLARASEREKEIATRISFGAGRPRLIRQLLTESVLLAILSGALGLALAYWGTRVLIAVGPENLPRIQKVGIDFTVLAVTLAASILTGMAFGLAPAIQFTKPALHESLKEGTRTSVGGVRSRRIRNVLVTGEIAVALTLLVVAGFIGKSFARLRGGDQGYNPDRVLTLQMSLPFSKYSTPAQRVAFYQQVLERVRALPNVEFAGIINLLPSVTSDQWNPVTVEGQPESPAGEIPRISVRAASPGFFRTMGIPVLLGRDFTDADLQVTKVIINESMAKRFWPNENPIGKRIALGLPPARTPFIDVVGMVKDVKQWVDAPADPTFYVSNLKQLSMTLAVKSAADPATLIPFVRKEVMAVDREQPVYNVVTMEQKLAASEPVSQARFRMLLLTLFAGSALVLATVGIYGLISYLVTQRTREIGIRMALGAQRRDVLKLVLSQGMMLTLVGVVLGLVAGYASTRMVSSLLFGVKETDLTIYIGTAAILACVACVATLIPARRATKVDPMVALRYE
jgi:putative ABC transport system permease protein